MGDHEKVGESEIILPKASFKKHVRAHGTKYSISNSQQYTSTGLDSLDSIIGGITIGSVVLIEEDAHSTCHSLMMQYFFAEGLALGHRLFLATKKPNALQVLKTLPQYLDINKSTRSSKLHSDETMKIAFQYQHLPKVSSEKCSRMYDFKKSIPWDTVEKSNPIIHNSEESDSASCYDKLLQDICSSIDPEHNHNRVLRIGLLSLHSTQWYKGSSVDENEKEFCTFLYRLRAIIRNSLVACYLTVPAELLTTAERVKRLCDICVKLESFEGRNTGELKNYRGSLNVYKMPAFNSQSCANTVCKQFVYKIERRKLTFEILHLPPAFDTSAPTGCQKEKKSLVDF